MLQKFRKIDTLTDLSKANKLVEMTRLGRLCINNPASKNHL